MFLKLQRFWSYAEDRSQMCHPVQTFILRSRRGLKSAAYAMKYAHDFIALCQCFLIDTRGPFY